MTRKAFFFISPGVLIGCLLAAPHVFAARPKADLEAGKAAYGQYCSRCHGDTGKGDGVDAKRFYPRPRDLSLGKYKFRTTATGTAPADEDIFQTITNGLPGSNMPDWKYVDEATRWQLVEYLKSLSAVFQDAPPGEVVIPADFGAKNADLKKGKEVYESLGCAACHGAVGRANGPSFAGLVDEWEMPIRPANLTQGWAYRGGSAAKDIVMRVLAGIDGSGMPSYDGAITPPEDVWQMAYYVESLQEKPHWNMIVHALKVEGELPTQASDARWQQAQATTLRIRNVVTPEGEWQHPPTVRALLLQVAYNDEAVTFKVSWDDPSQEIETPPDALAVLLKTQAIHGDVVSLQAWPYQGSPDLDATYWAANSENAAAALISNFESLTSEAAAKGSIPVSASYEEGRWSVVIRHGLKPGDARGAEIKLSDFTGVSFAVWDAGNDNSRAVSPWVDLMLQHPKDSSAHEGSH